jgi:hypothetical protein
MASSSATPGVSTGKQDLALQLDALEQLGCARVFSREASRAGDRQSTIHPAGDHGEGPLWARHSCSRL